MNKLLAAVSLFLLCACGSGETNIDQYAQMIRSEGWSVTICHFPPGNVENVQTITVGHPSVLAAHLRHGDHLGECTCEDLDNCEPPCEKECCGDDCPPPPTCPNYECDNGETCTTCPHDCGSCKPVCGDQECNGLETCATCPLDCGECEPRCGDEVCHLDEDCETCSVDCGECPPPPPFCGDETCDIGESCENCVEDCGQCPPPPCTENCGGEPDAGVPDAGTPEPPVTPPTLGKQSFAVTGGCNTVPTGSFGGLALGFLIMVLGAFLFVRGRRVIGIAVVLLGLVVATATSAHAFPTQNFKPAAGTQDYWTTEDAKVSLPSVKLLWHYENDPLVLENLTTGARKDLINHRHSLHLLGAYSLYNRVQLSADVPLVIGQWNGPLTGLGASDAEGGLANIRLGVKVRIASWEHLGLGIGVDVGLPTSTVDYVDDAGFTVTPKAIVSSYIGPVALAINAGLRVRDPDSFTPNGGIKEVIIESDFVGSAAANWKIWNNDSVAFNLVSDLYLSVPLRAAQDRTMPVEWINGLKVGLPAGFALSAGAGVGLTSGVGAPDYRILGGLSWAYEPKPEECKVEPVYQIQVVQGPPIVEEVPVPVPVPTINPVYFPFDKHDLTLEAQATLLDAVETVRWIENNVQPVEVILLVGRADRRGSNDYNLKLAQRRAESVEAFLKSHGLENVTFEIESQGEEQSDQETADELKLQLDRTVIVLPIIEE